MQSLRVYSKIPRGTGLYWGFCGAELWNHIREWRWVWKLFKKPIQVYKTHTAGGGCLILPIAPLTARFWENPACCESLTYIAVLLRRATFQVDAVASDCYVTDIVRNLKHRERRSCREGFIFGKYQPCVQISLTSLLNYHRWLLNNYLQH